jgi:hypothetical protein
VKAERDQAVHAAEAETRDHRRGQEHVTALVKADRAAAIPALPFDDPPS